MCSKKEPGSDVVALDPGELGQLPSHWVSPAATTPSSEMQVLKEALRDLVLRLGLVCRWCNSEVSHINLLHVLKRLHPQNRQAFRQS